MYIKTVEKFKYFGSIIQQDGSSQTDEKKKIREDRKAIPR